MRLGETQRRCLRALADFGTYPGGWKYGNASTTVRTLDSLVRKGLVERQEERLGISLTGPPRVSTVYRINDKGREALGQGTRS